MSSVSVSRRLRTNEITASSLVKLDLDGNIVEENEYGLNPAGVVIHSAVLRGRPDINSVVHTHTRAGMAVSAQENGLLPLTQTALRKTMRERFDGAMGRARFAYVERTKISILTFYLDDKILLVTLEPNLDSHTVMDIAEDTLEMINGKS